MGEVSIKVGERTYRLQCGDGDEERLKELGAYFGAKVDALQTEVGAVGADRLLVMAALMIADELWDARAGIEASPAPESAPVSPPDATNFAIKPEGATAELVKNLEEAATKLRALSEHVPLEKAATS